MYQRWGCYYDLLLNELMRLLPPNPETRLTPRKSSHLKQTLAEQRRDFLPSILRAEVIYTRTILS
jgi:hypothetical protein